MSATVVEVKDDDTSAYYQGYIKDLQKDGQVLVRFENEWKADEWVPASKVRQAVPQHDPAAFNPKVGDAVEAMAKTHENEPFSWWRAVVKNVRSEFFFIRYSDWDDSYNEIVEKELLRPPNPNPHLDTVTLVKKELPIPNELWESDEELRDQAAIAEKQRNYAELQDTSRVLSLIEDASRHVLCIIGPGAATDNCIVLCNMYFKQRQQKKQLRAKIANQKKILEDEKKKVDDSVIEEFNVPPELMGLVIGKKGKNVREVEQLPGIVSVKVISEAGKVRIVAKARDVAREARRRLEFIEELFPVKRRLLPRIVGPKFQSLRDIEAASKVQRITVPRPEEKDARRGGDYDEVNMTIVGTSDTVSSAKMLLQKHLSHVMELQQLEEDSRQVQTQLRELNLEYGVGPRGAGVERGRGRGRGRGSGTSADADEAPTRGRGRGRGGAPPAEEADAAAAGGDAPRGRGRRPRKAKGDADESAAAAAVAE